MIKFIIMNKKQCFIKDVEDNIHFFCYNYNEAKRFDTLQEAWNFIAKHHIPFCDVVGIKIK